MDVVIAGAHGQIAMLVHPLLIARGHRVRGLIRNPEHVRAINDAGADAVLCDLEVENDITEAIGDADAVIFAAGAGPGSGAARKSTMDRDGAVKLMQAALHNHVKRYIMISAMHAEEPRGDEVFRSYLQAKSDADAALRDSDLNYTIVRPGRLTNEPGTGCVSLAAKLPAGDIPRADVAAVLAAVVDVPSSIGHQFDLTSGRQAIETAVDSLGQTTPEAGC